MERRWKIKEPGDSAVVEALAGELNVDKIVANLLVQRGVDSFSSAKSFFRPSLDDLHDPFLMKDMDIAVDRLCKAIRSGERIMIYGDYDVDGTTAVALVFSFLRRYYQNLLFYIPDRYTEGYGISTKGIEAAADSGCSLIISLDCGIKAVNKIRYAKNFGIDFIVCDHHTPGEALPEALACIDPKRQDDTYPYKDLSGCGVGFKLLQAFCLHNGYPVEPLYKYLDLVAVSIAADIVPITGENRILAYYGLKQLNNDPGTGLKSIIHVSNMEGKELEMSDVVFKIGPRINAAGRIESGRDAVELLVSGEEELAKSLSANINGHNEVRKDLDKKITDEALQLLINDPSQKERKSTVLFRPHWHKGVIGIVAFRLMDKFYRPTVIITESQGLATGSARSVEGFDLYSAVESCSDLLISFGGHTSAAGLTMDIGNVELFAQRFEEWVEAHITPEQMIPQVEIDAEIRLKDINARLMRLLAQFAPFGPANQKPLFVTRRVIDYGTTKLVGKGRDHIKFELIEECSGAIVRGIGFSMKDHLTKIQSREPFDIVYSIEENVYNGVSSVQLMIKDLLFPY